MHKLGLSVAFYPFSTCQISIPSLAVRHHHLQVEPLRGRLDEIATHLPSTGRAQCLAGCQGLQEKLQGGQVLCLDGRNCSGGQVVVVFEHSMEIEVSQVHYRSLEKILLWGFSSLGLHCLLQLHTVRPSKGFVDFCPSLTSPFHDPSQA